MMYFTFSDYAISSLSFFLLGAIGGVLYRSINSVFSFILKLFALLISAFRSDSPVPHTSFSKRAKHSNILVFLFFMIIGIFYILFCYVFLDGEVRIYNFIIFILSFLFFKKYLSFPIEHVIEFVQDKLYRMLFFFAYWLVYPIKALFNATKRALLPHIINFRHRRYRKLFNRFIDKECRSIEKTILGSQHLIF